MKYLKTTAIAAMSVIATLAVASIAGFQINEIIAEEGEDNGYIFAEDLKVTAQFTFRDGIELSQFEVFDQKSGFNTASEPASFVLERVVGYTPLLHKAVDEAHKWSRGSTEFQYKFFDVNVLLAKGGEVFRQFDYDKCRITNYEVETLRDKEEGWNTSKGFVIVDQFEFTCDGYSPQSVTYEKMMTPEKTTPTTSSLDLEEPKEFWYDHIKYQSPSFGN